LIGPVRGDLVPSLLLTTPIPDPDEPARILGTLVGILDWERLTGVTESVRRDLAEQGVAADVLISLPDGTVIGGTRADPVAGRRGDAGAALPGPRRAASPDYVVDAGAGLIFGRAALAPDLPDWTLLVVESRDDALAPALRSSRRLALAMGLALVAALALATLAARRVVQPLSELTRAIRGLSGAGGARQVPVRTEDEVGALAVAFNEMAAELDRAQRELVEAEKFAFVGELAAGVAHEIRTALNVLGSSAQILERSLSRDAGPEAAELAEMIRAEVGRLSGVVSDLLTLARGRPPVLEPGRISEPVFRAADFVAPQAREKGIRLARAAPPREPVLPFDSDLLYQVAVNLLVNAVEVLGHGGCIDVRVLEEKDGFGGFEVRDDGPGIPDGLGERIFDPFVTGREGGVGLGLTFVKRVVHDHRGLVSAESAAGAGTRIWIRLPVASAR
jgi:signal transduction histidine kinase